MSTDSTDEGSGPAAGAGGSSGQPSEEELRAAYEAELSRITSSDMMLQAAVSLLNIGGRRLGAAGRAPGNGPGAEAQAPDAAADADRDLEQVRDAVDAVRALLEILERRLPAELGPLRDALSQLQIAYARAVAASAADAMPGSSATDAEGQDAPPDRPAVTDETGSESAASDQSPAESGRPGPAEASGRLWVPGR